MPSPFFFISLTLAALYGLYESPGSALCNVINLHSSILSPDILLFL